MSLGEVGDEFRRVVDGLARVRAQVTASANRLNALRQRLAELGHGSDHRRLTQTQARYGAAVQVLQEANAANAAAGAAIQTYLTAIGVTAQPSPLSSMPGPASAPPDGSRHDELIKHARESLPPGLKGAQTQGRWVTADGTLEHLSSGKDDEWYQKTKTFAATLPPHLKAAARLAVHLETKFAVRMREEGRLQETIVIDREVCGRGSTDHTMPFTCDKQLKRFLPPGGELTVVEHDGTRRTYQGEKA